ncbi:pirin family protein [Kitasatospora nipponensis]|uniref:Pirin family protein n=1 Tax=Kitasatospora nipponensis TaxID=258049 RepID=A0ABN1T8K5_9ACTN
MTTTTGTATATAAPAGTRPTPSTRSTVEVIDPVHTLEGAGFPVRRPFPVPELPFLDPFLMIDQTGPLLLAPGEAKGAPDHPHRGFEAVSYVIEGAMEYADSAGHRGVTGPGDVQWLTAGAGIVHSNMPSAELLERGGRQHLVQIWVNLPARLKGLPPHTQNHGPGTIPTVPTGDGGELTVIAGSTHGVTGPFDTHLPVLLVHARLAAGGRAEFTVPAHHNAAVYVLSGAAAVPAAALADGRLAVLAQDGERIVVTAPGDAAEVLVLAGEPIGEPVARGGPFVMNTVEELRQAQADFAAGRLGRSTS